MQKQNKQDTVKVNIQIIFSRSNEPLMQQKLNQEFELMYVPVLIIAEGTRKSIRKYFNGSTKNL